MFVWSFVKQVKSHINQTRLLYWRPWFINTAIAICKFADQIQPVTCHASVPCRATRVVVNNWTVIEKICLCPCVVTWLSKVHKQDNVSIEVWTSLDLEVSLFQAVFFIAAQSGQVAQLKFSYDWATWPIWAAVQKYSLRSIRLLQRSRVLVIVWHNKMGR